MKVLHIFNEISFSGAEIMYANAASLFEQNGYEIVAIATGENPGNYEQEFARNGIIIIHKPIKPGFKSPLFYFLYIRAITKIIKEQFIDIIHIHRASYMILFAICGAVSRKKVIRTVHNVFKSKTLTWAKGWAERLLARKLFHVTFHTIGDSVYTNELLYYRNFSVKVNNWYDASRFYPVAGINEKFETKIKLGLPLNKFIIISVGSCTTIKNHHDIIKALAIANSGREYYYIHLGQGNTECQEKELASNTKAIEDILFAGNKRNVRDYLISSDIFVMTSRFEGLGNSAVEAMACGIPLLLYNSPGLHDLITDNDCGFLIDKNVSALVDNLEFARNNPEVLKIKSVNGLQKAQKNYSMDNKVMDIINLYKC